MPKPRKNEEIKCRHFRWLLGQRNGVYFADGRSNEPSLGKLSLGTKNYKIALQDIHELDHKMAVKSGLADPTVHSPEESKLLPLTEGRRLYEKHVARPQIAGGPKPISRKRYRAVLDKSIPFFEKQGLTCWNQIKKSYLDSYAAWLDGEGYAYATEYLELNTIKTIMKFLVEYEHLPPQCLFKYPLVKPDETDTYCYKPGEVTAMLQHCEEREMNWLYRILLTLACTGLRIGELAQLSWSNIDLENQRIMLRDESTSRRVTGRKKRTTKTKSSRIFPINKQLLPVLKGIPRRRDGLVLHGPLGGKVKADTIRNVLIRDVLAPLEKQFPSEPNEIGFKDGRLHSFRHYFCSVCANSGVPEQVLMRWLGHKSSRMVKRYYHLHDEESQRQMSRVQVISNKEADSAGESD
ncbi:MAG: site-specific integrase [Planctomycetaceae bacterium]|nr:site-specific integrase [Planctomycetaceae bacterium]